MSYILKGPVVKPSLRERERIEEEANLVLGQTVYFRGRLVGGSREDAALGVEVSVFIFCCRNCN
jgi:hypothetical protein